jgi:hypothetical protein
MTQLTPQQGHAIQQWSGIRPTLFLDMKVEEYWLTALGFVELLRTCAEKDIHLNLTYKIGDDKGWKCFIFWPNNGRSVDADTPELALALAVLKLINETDHE